MFQHVLTIIINHKPLVSNSYCSKGVCVCDMVWRWNTALSTTLWPKILVFSNYKPWSTLPFVIERCNWTSTTQFNDFPSSTPQFHVGFPCFFPCFCPMLFPCCSQTCPNAARRGHAAPAPGSPQRAGDGPETGQGRAGLLPGSPVGRGRRLVSGCCGVGQVIDMKQLSKDLEYPFILFQL